MASLNGPSDLQYLKDCNIQSNSKIVYKDITSNNYENRIKLDPENETKMDIRNYIPLNHLSQTIIKEYPEEINAFDKFFTNSSKIIRSHFVSLYFFNEA